MTTWTHQDDAYTDIVHGIKGRIKYIREYCEAAKKIEGAEKTPLHPVKAEFFKGILNPKKRLNMDAEVIHSGIPNKVKVYVSRNYMPEIKLDAYRAPLKVGEIIIVAVTVSKKKEIIQASFIIKKNNCYIIYPKLKTTQKNLKFVVLQNR